ncbi:hypothetical protein Tco_0650477 [Tanacetum coccineum]
MEAIQSFLKEYDHIPPNEKCMALLLVEERFLKIKQTMKEEQNQPEVIQDLLLKLMNDLQILKGIQQEQEKTATQSFTPYWNFSMIDDEEARENFMKDICTFLRKFSQDIQELMSKLLGGCANISVKEFSDIINYHAGIVRFSTSMMTMMSILYKEKALKRAHRETIEARRPLSWGKRNLALFMKRINLVLRTSSQSQVDPRVFPTIFVIMIILMLNLCLVKIFDLVSLRSIFFSKEFSVDGDSYNTFGYVEASPLNLEYYSEDQEEKEFDLEDIFQIQDVILREKFLNISRIITNIESLKDNPTPDYVFKSPSSFPIPVVDSDSFFEESDTSLSHLDNSLPKFETFSDHIEEMRSGNNSLLELPEFESFHFDQLFPRPPLEPPDVEISLIIENDAPVINNVGEIDVEDDDSFTFVIRTFLPFLTYPEVSPLLSSTKNEDTIFDPGIST